MDDYDLRGAALANKIAMSIGNRTFTAEFAAKALRQAHADGVAEAIEEVRAILRPVDAALMALKPATETKP